MKRASERGGSTRLAELAGSIVTVLAVGAASSALAQTAIQQSPNPTATPAPAKPKPAPKKPDPDDELVIRATRSAYQALPGAVVGDIEPELDIGEDECNLRETAVFLHISHDVLIGIGAIIVGHRDGADYRCHLF